MTKPQEIVDSQVFENSAYITDTHKRFNSFFQKFLDSHCMVNQELKTKLAQSTLKKTVNSKKALAVPVTFLILFVTMLGIISITYYFAVEKVNARSQTLKISTARQSFLSLDQSLLSILWQAGSARVFEVSDSGGRIRIQPQTNSLTLSITYGRDIDSSIYNQIIGEIDYDLPYSDSPDTGLYLRGDSRSIVNQSGSVITQLSIERGVQNAEIVLRYRPSVSYANVGFENDKALNVVRIYIVNLNSSEEIMSYGNIPIRISTESTVISETRFDVSYSLEKLRITSVYRDISGQVLIPIHNSTGGAIIEVEVVECNIRLERCLR